VSLIALFVLQTILQPLAILWLFVEGMKAMAARSKDLFASDSSPPR
jgi:hypothetical protein